MQVQWDVACKKMKLSCFERLDVATGVEMEAQDSLRVYPVGIKAPDSTQRRAHRCA